ncbi:MAG: yjjX [Candidatus Doudnabacteria bacterium]|nr:yjjX [Candidatus Doudnabacteria bacterium]
MRVLIGSKNPVKIEATRLAFERVWPEIKNEKEFSFEGFDVASGVAAQPMSDDEAVLGARNRAKALMKLGEADYYVGLEGGSQFVDDRYYECGWIVVLDKFMNQGIGSTLKIELPKVIEQMILEGMELGDVVDKVFETHNSKQASGFFGLITNGHITRTDAYRDGVICALARFIQPTVFEK